MCPASGVGHDGDSGLTKPQSEDRPGVVSITTEFRTKSIDVIDGFAASPDFNLPCIMMSEPVLDPIDSPRNLIDDLIRGQPGRVGHVVPHKQSKAFAGLGQIPFPAEQSKQPCSFDGWIWHMKP